MENGKRRRGKLYDTADCADLLGGCKIVQRRTCMIGPLGLICTQSTTSYAFSI